MLIHVGFAALCGEKAAVMGRHVGIPEVAKALGVHRCTIHRFINEESPSAYLLAGFVTFFAKPERVIVKYLRRGRTKRLRAQRKSRKERQRRKTERKQP